jgi:predicted DNA-binding ribbon-helix-helix protein
MCNIFAGQDPASYACVTRSVRLSGHVTSIRLEAQFWSILDEIARHQGLSTPRFLGKLYDEALEIHGEVGNFTSLLRNACVIYLRQPETVADAQEMLTPA